MKSIIYLAKIYEMGLVCYEGLRLGNAGVDT